MKITFIHHSGFLVELDHSYLLFDYIEPSGEGSILPELKPGKPLIVMASHRHGDHFMPVIFRLADIHRPTNFLLSYDIKKRNVPEEQLPQTDFIRYGETVTYGEAKLNSPDGGKIVIEALKSTDEGVAFLVTAEGKTIYHAGDLNNWTWNGEPDSWNKNMETNYRREIGLIAGRKIDLAFIPLDPRLQDKFYLGIDDFMKRVGAEVVFPMHLWGEFDTIGRFKELPCAKEYRDRIIEVHGDHESFSL